MKVVVLGAGVVGVACAYYLARDGHRVVVIDRQPGAGLETSFANGGQVSASHAVPWANPRTPRKILAWLGRDDAPLVFPWWRPDPALWAWAVRFLVNCTAARTAVNLERTLRVALYSRIQLAALQSDTGIAYDQRRRGILHIYRDRREFEAFVGRVEAMNRLGCALRVLDPAGCVAVEPALAEAAAGLVGGTYSPDDESGDAHLFTRRLAEVCAGLGVDFRYGMTVRGLVRDGGRIAGVETAAGRVVGDHYVMALGSYSPLLLRPLGLRLPVYPAKGYSVTLPVAADGVAPEVSLTDDENKLVYSRLGERLRIAGTAEMRGWNTQLVERRARQVLDKALALFPRCGERAAAESWTGLRPKTPDSVPVIGPTPFANLTLDTGHGTLGWTMACGSGRVVADVVGGRAPGISLDGLTLSRFG